MPLLLYFSGMHISINFLGKKCQSLCAGAPPNYYEAQTTVVSQTRPHFSIYERRSCQTKIKNSQSSFDAAPYPTQAPQKYGIPSKPMRQKLS